MQKTTFASALQKLVRTRIIRGCVFCISLISFVWMCFSPLGCISAISTLPGRVALWPLIDNM